MEEVEKIVDVDKVIKNGKNRFLRSLPRFVISFIKKVIHQDEINSTIHNSRHLSGIPYINDVLDKWGTVVETRGIENVPADGRYIFASNHPLGGIDALAFFSAVGEKFPSMISPSNQLLYNIPNIRPLMLPLNVFGRNTKETSVKLAELLDSEKQVFMFPAGEVSRRKKGKISDPVWQKSFITKAVQHKRDIVPVHISGRNSNFFYIVANLRTFLGIKMYVETMLLPHEMFRQKKAKVIVTFGKPISYQAFTSEKTHQEWALEVKSIVYSLTSNNK